MDHKVKNFKYILIAFTFLLAIFGIIMVKEASGIWAEYIYQDKNYFFKRQLIFVSLGVVAFLIGYYISPFFLYKFSNIFLLISILLLGLVLIPGVGIVRIGSRSWFGVGGFGIQPSEIFKISLLIWTAKYFYKNYQKTEKLMTLVLPLIVVGIGFFLIMLEPDFGTALVTLMAFIMMVFITKMKMRYFVIMGSALVFGFSLLILSAPYRFTRIISFLDPFKDPLGSGFQMIQSLYSIGPSGIAGIGFGNSIQKNFYLPEPQTDFIFAIIVEEFGLIGGIIILICYGLLFYYGYKYALSFNTFSCFLKVGLLNVIMMQTLINLCVVVGLLPVTGITLPLISYGGSSLVITLFSLGIIAQKGDYDEIYTISKQHSRTHLSLFRNR